SSNTCSKAHTSRDANWNDLRLDDRSLGATCRRRDRRSSDPIGSGNHRGGGRGLLLDHAAQYLPVCLEHVVLIVPGGVHETLDAAKAAARRIPFFEIVQVAVVITSNDLPVSSLREPLETLHTVIEVPVRNRHLGR